MMVMIHATTAVVEINGAPCRVWQGHSKGGAEVQCLMHIVAVKPEDDAAFNAEWRASPAVEPITDSAFPPEISII